MSVWRILRSLLSKRPHFLLENVGKVKEAFVHKGTTYYMFDNIFNTPTIRGLQALDYYDEFNMRCTKEYLVKFCDAIEAILSNTKKLEMVRLAQLTTHLRERLTMIPVPDHIYRLASVVFFDGTENPYIYDREYAAKKIERWKSDPEMLTFFLQTPLKDLIPFLDLQATNIHTYSAVVQLINETHLKTVLSQSLERDTKVAM